MKLAFAVCVFLIAVSLAAASSFPVITSQPQNQTVSPGNTAVFNVIATGATAYQWQSNGATVPGATNSTLTVPNAQLSDAGYYLVLVKNSFGWTPSSIVYLSVVDTAGRVPFSTTGNSHAEA